MQKIYRKTPVYRRLIGLVFLFCVFLCTNLLAQTIEIVKKGDQILGIRTARKGTEDILNPPSGVTVERRDIPDVPDMKQIIIEFFQKPIVVTYSHNALQKNSLSQLQLITIEHDRFLSDLAQLEFQSREECTSRSGALLNSIFPKRSESEPCKSNCGNLVWSAGKALCENAVV